jgi:hypothetical protein
MSQPSQDGRCPEQDFERLLHLPTVFPTVPFDYLSRADIRVDFVCRISETFDNAFSQCPAIRFEESSQRAQNPSQALAMKRKAVRGPWTRAKTASQSA